MIRLGDYVHFSYQQFHSAWDPDKKHNKYSKPSEELGYGKLLKYSSTGALAHVEVRVNGIKEIRFIPTRSLKEAAQPKERFSYEPAYNE